jgi:protein-ribulosamine 3-kinase
MNRQIILSRAYNDMLFLCEKYAPLETLEKYNPKKDISVTGAYTQHSTQSMKDEYLNG